MRFDMCPRGHIAGRFQQELANIIGRHEGMFDNLHDGPVTCVGVWVSQHFGKQFPEKPIGERCEGAIASTSSPSGRSILAHRPGEVQRNGPPHYGAWGRWENYK